jgi:hypothetical protein
LALSESAQTTKASSGTPKSSVQNHFQDRDIARLSTLPDVRYAADNP